MSEDEEYYTAAEAQRVLGLKEAVFFQRVRKGEIPKFRPKGSKQGVYPKKLIDALAQATDLLFEQYPHIEFSRSRLAEQEEEMRIGIKCFGAEYITPLPERVAFQMKSPYTFWSLKVNGKVVGYISMFRLEADLLDDLLTGRRVEREITVRDVLPFERRKPFNVYVDVLAIDPDLPPHARHLYAGIIVTRMADTILDLIANRYQIQALYTVSATAEGDNLIRKAGFQFMKGKSEDAGRKAYMFHLDEQGIQQLQDRSRRNERRTEDPSSVDRKP